jgi:hypothetical protein
MVYGLLFLTFWIDIFIILHKYTYNYINLLYLAFIMLFMGSYISFIRPGFIIYKFDNEIIKFNNVQKFIIVDLFLHLFFFTFIYYTQVRI